MSLLKEELHFCKADGCKRYGGHSGYCSNHRYQLKKHEKITSFYEAKACKIPDCPYWAEVNGLCRKCQSKVATKRYQSSEIGKAAKKKRYHNNKELHASIARKAYLGKFGLTFEKEKEILEAQDNLCIICRKPETSAYKEKIKRLSLDHDHVTGEFRGFLCNKCNRLIGLAQDNPNVLRAAAKYLENYYLSLLSGEMRLTTIGEQKQVFNVTD